MIHVLLAVLSIVLMLISVGAYRRRPNGRYLFLMLAFVFLCADQIITLWQEVYYGGQLIMIPFVELHLVHLLELLMIISFLVALLRPSGEPKP